MSLERLKLENAYLVQHVCISHRMTVGVVRSYDLILQYNVKVGNKAENINVKYTCQFKTWCKAINQT